MLQESNIFQKSESLFGEIDVTGRVVTTTALTSVFQTINVSSLAKGTYLYQVASGTTLVTTGKLVIQ